MIKSIIGNQASVILMFFFFKFYRIVLERSTTHIDTVLTYCRCTMHDTGLLDYMQFFKVRININNNKLNDFVFYSLVLIFCQAVCDIAAGTAWNTVPIWQQKWLATKAKWVSTAPISVKLTWVSLCRHAGSKDLQCLSLPAALCPSMLE